MRVCILSMQRVPNLGSLLQCYGLKKTLEKLGHEVEFIDIEENQGEAQTGEKNRLDFSHEFEEKSFFSMMKKLDRYAVNRIVIKGKNRKQEQEFEKFRKNSLGLCEESNRKSYDVCIIGSDEVFNCLSSGFHSQLFGNVRQAKRVISYAASCGATTLEALPEDLREKIGKAFQNISSFSVRDDNTRRFVEALAHRRAICHLDPVLIYDFSKELEQESLPKGLPEHFCVVYSYYNRIHKESERRAVLQFCKERKLQPVSVGAPQMWIKKHLVLSPLQVFAVFRKADFVITDTFHGTVFAAKASEKFAVLPRDSNRNKLVDLITALGLKEHQISSMEELSLVAERKKDSDRLDAFLERERERTVQYLRDNIR